MKSNIAGGLPWRLRKNRGTIALECTTGYYAEGGADLRALTFCVISLGATIYSLLENQKVEIWLLNRTQFLRILVVHALALKGKN